MSKVFFNARRREDAGDFTFTCTRHDTFFALFKKIERSRGNYLSGRSSQPKGYKNNTGNYSVLYCMGLKGAYYLGILDKWCYFFIKRENKNSREGEERIEGRKKRRKSKKGRNSLFARASLSFFGWVFLVAVAVAHRQPTTTAALMLALMIMNSDC